MQRINTTDGRFKNYNKINLTAGTVITAEWLNAVQEEITNAFSKASISHILAISGTHVSYIIFGITYILTKSKVPKRKSYLCMICFLILFILV